MKNSHNAIAVLLMILLCVSFSGCSTKNTYEDDYHSMNETNISVTESQTEGIDPFKNLTFYLVGNNGEASLCSTTSSILIPTHEEDYLLLIQVDMPTNNGSISNGDLIHVTISDQEIERAKEMYAIELTRTEADVEVHGLNAYGTSDAYDGDYGVIHLNDYLRFYGDSSCIQATFNYSLMLQDFTHSMSENVPYEELNPGETSSFEITRIISQYKPFEAQLVSVSSDGKYANFTWVINEEALALLKEVMNIDITYEDIVYKIK